MFDKRSTRNVNRLAWGVCIPLLFAALALWLGGTALATESRAIAATHTVCASGCDFSSIQAAVDGAADGDTLELAAETFTELVTIDKSLTILGTDRDSTIIQAANAPGIATSRVMTVTQHVTVTIDNVTVRYGAGQGTSVYDWAAFGGGIYSDGNLTLSNSAVVSNTSIGLGGGMYCLFGRLTLSNVVFSGNTAGTRGGGLAMECHYPALTDVSFSGNTAADYGGGMYSAGTAYFHLTNVTFTGNSAYHGGGFSTYEATGYLDNVDFYDNSAGYNGGGLSQGGGWIVFTGGVLYGNSADRDGGGIAAGAGSTFSNLILAGNSAGNYGGGVSGSLDGTTFENMLFSGNSAMGHGGGLYNDAGSPTFMNVTFAGNSAGWRGGAINNYQAGNPTLTNAILWGNTDSTGSEQIYNAFSVPTIRYSIVQDCGDSGTWNTACGTDGGHNLDLDPLFVRDPDPGDGDWTTPADNDYGNLHLAGLSPAVNSGTNAGCPATDLDGVPRPYGAQCDRGAYENAGSVLAVCTVGTVVGADYATIQQALDSDDHCGLIYIYPGLYHESVSIDHSLSLVGLGDQSAVVTGDDLDHVFSIRPGITVTMKNLAVTQGQGCIDNRGTLILQDVSIEYCTTTAMGGGIYNAGVLQADNVDLYFNRASSGGGIHNAAGSSARISNARLSGNSATASGGAISAAWGTLGIRIENSRIWDNFAGDKGGALSLGPLDECLIADSEIDANRADGSGGGIWAQDAGHPLTMKNTSVVSNQSGAEGGGLWVGGSLVMVNNTFSRNHADNGGGGAYVLWHSNGYTGTITATTFSQNTAPLGGGIYTGFRGNELSIADSTIISNTSSDSGGGLYIDGSMADPSSGVTITHSTIGGNVAANTGGGIATKDEYPGEVNLRIRTTTIENNEAGQGGGIYNNIDEYHHVRFDIRFSTIRDNHSTAGNGGGIYFDAYDANSSLKLNSSTVSGNTATWDGGGLAMVGGVLTTTNSTYSGNVARRNGGGILLVAGSGTTADLQSLTITENTADDDQDDAGDGGGLYRLSPGGAVTVTASILAGNHDLSSFATNPDDCDGTFTTGTFNLIGTNHSCSGWVALDIIGLPGSPEDPMLLPLADNGGPTWTHAPDPNSPAVDGNAWADCPNKDQRGLGRPQDGDGDNNAVCDIGAFELGTCGPASTPTLAIARDGQDLLLTWNDDNANREYVVARVTDYIQQTDLFTTTVQANRYTDYGAIGDPDNNYVYVVRGENACGDRSGRSNKVAEFDFPILDDDTSDRAAAAINRRALHLVLLTVPLTGSDLPTTSDALAAYIDPNGSVEGVGKWNPNTGSWIIRRVGCPGGTRPFSISPGDVLAIGLDRDTAPATLAFVGDIPANGSLQNTLIQQSLNFVMVPLDQSGAFALDADGLAAAIGGVPRVAVWHPFEQRWYLRNTNTGIGPNFPIRLGWPYAIYANDTAPLAWP